MPQEIVVDRKNRRVGMTFPPSCHSHGRWLVGVMFDSAHPQARGVFVSWISLSVRRSFRKVTDGEYRHMSRTLMARRYDNKKYLRQKHLILSRVFRWKTP